MVLSGAPTRKSPTLFGPIIWATSVTTLLGDGFVSFWKEQAEGWMEATRRQSEVVMQSVNCNWHKELSETVRGAINPQVGVEKCGDFNERLLVNKRRTQLSLVVFFSQISCEYIRRGLTLGTEVHVPRWTCTSVMYNPCLSSHQVATNPPALLAEPRGMARCHYGTGKFLEEPQLDMTHGSGERRDMSPHSTWRSDGMWFASSVLDCDYWNQVC